MQDASQARFDLVKLAETVGAGVVDLNNRLNFPTMHPLNVSYAEKNCSRKRIWYWRLM
jgi:hypothetical protein